MLGSERLAIVLVREQNVTDTSFTSPGATTLTTGHQYRWWVRAIGEDGVVGSWSAATEFTLNLVSNSSSVTPSRRYNV